MAKKKKKKLLIFIFVIVALLVLIGIGQALFGPGGEGIPVKLGKVEKRTITQTVSAIGKIEPETEIKISSETSGEIIFLGVNEGDTVKAGELLVRIKPDIIETQLEQYEAAAEATKIEIDVAKAEKERLKSSLSRITQLFESEFASKDEFERAKTLYDQAQARYQATLSRYSQAKASLKQIHRSKERTTIFAPNNGIVTLLNVEKGEKVVGTEMMAGTEMMRISDLSVMNAVVEVDENDIVQVNIGDTCRIEIDAFPDSIYTGQVIEIGHSAMVNALGSQDQVTNFEVKIRLNEIEYRLRPGMSCSVDIETETREDVISVPLSAVTIREVKKKEDKKPEETKAMRGRQIKKEDENEDKKRSKMPSVVFVSKGGRALMKEVKTGISDNGFIEIKEGLETGQKIVTGSYSAVSKMLSDSSKIHVDEGKKGKGFGK